MGSKVKNQPNGFTLVEFMIANLVILIVFAATFTLLQKVFLANSRMQQVLSTQQNLRVAMNTITRDITMAGTGLPEGGIPIPNGTNAVPLVRMGLGTPCPNPPGTGPGCMPTPNNVIAIITPGDGIGPTIATVTTDAITLAAVDQTSPTWNISSISTDGTVIDFTQDITASPTQLSTNDLLVFSNANGLAFGCVTDVKSASRAEFKGTDILNINQPTAQYGTVAASLQNPGSSPVTYPPTSATRVMLITYHIDNTNTQNPKLMRGVNASAAQVMVEGIENLQFSFDLFDFTNNTETSNLATTANPNQIRSVRLAINGHSPEKLRQANDYYHFGLVSKINVRNVTFRNRYS
jgi:Tfp pilus assembly protein PilW